MFKKLFGSDRREIWNQVARELNAEVFEGGMLRPEHTVTVQAHDWHIVLDYHLESSGNSSAEYTRMRAPFLNPKGLEFKLSKANFMVDAANRLFRLQDIEVGYPFFDRRFVIKGNDEAAVKRIFENMKIRASLMDIKAGTFRATKKDTPFKSLPAGASYLEQRIYGVVKDPAMLKEMFALFRRTLTEIYEYSYDEVLEPGARPMLDEIKQKLENDLAWCTPIVERRGKGLEAPLVCRAFNEYRGHASISPPTLPERLLDVSIEVEVPMMPHALSLRSLETMTDRALNLTDDNIGDAELDKALIIDGDARAFLETKAELETILSRWKNMRAHFEGERLHVVVNDISDHDVLDCLSLLHAYWKKSIDCAARISRKGLTP